MNEETGRQALDPGTAGPPGAPPSSQQAASAPPEPCQSQALEPGLRHRLPGPCSPSASHQLLGGPRHSPGPASPVPNPAFTATTPHASPEAGRGCGAAAGQPRPLRPALLGLPLRARAWGHQAPAPLSSLRLSVGAGPGTVRFGISGLYPQALLSIFPAVSGWVNRRQRAPASRLSRPRASHDSPIT